MTLSVIFFVLLDRPKTSSTLCFLADSNRYWVPSFGNLLFSFFRSYRGQHYGDGCALAAHPSFAFCLRLKHEQTNEEMLKVAMLRQSRLRELSQLSRSVISWRSVEFHRIL